MIARVEDRRRLRRAGLGAAMAVAAAVAALPTQTAGAVTEPPATVTGAVTEAPATAKVNIVHGIPGVAVKVCVDGKPAVRGFTYGEKVTGAALPAGTHRMRVVPAGKACSAKPVLRKKYDLQAGKNYTVVAALRPSGAPALASFATRVRPTEEGMARLTVRHTAQAPAVNVWAGSTRLIGGTRFTWGDTRTLTAPEDTYRVKVTLPGSREPVIGPRHLTLRSGTAYQVHAVGAPGHYRLVVVGVPVGEH